MKKLLLAGAIALAALTATPAVAQPYVEVNTGLTDTNIGEAKVNYGLTIGADQQLNQRLSLGVDATASDVFRDNGRTLGAGMRLGYAITPGVKAFVRGGYANLDAGQHLNGLAAGGGFNFSLNPRLYVNTEYRYTNYEQGVTSNAGLVGLGIRF